MKENLAAIYVRLSKEDLDGGIDGKRMARGKGGKRRESESIQNQKAMLTEYAEKMNWRIYRIYCDEDYSGAYSGEENIRPSFNKMITDAKNGEFNIILCKSQSRFSRNMEVVEQYLHGRFPDWGIRFVSLVDHADTAVKGNKKARQINSLINEWYLEDLSENIKAVFRDKMKRGEYIAAFPPYGYERDPENRHHLVVNPPAAQVVAQIFSWHKQGYGMTKISQMLNAMEVPNPRKQQELDGLRKTCLYERGESGLWSAGTVGDILKNRVYCGDVVQHTREKVSYKSRTVKKVDCSDWIVAENMHEPIIDRETFAETQSRLRQRRKASGKGKIHLLSGIVHCHYCGKPMQKIHGQTALGERTYLRCRNKYLQTREKRCPVPNIRIELITEALQIPVWMHYAQTILEKMDRGRLRRLLDADREEEREWERLQRLKAERKAVKKSLDLLYADRLNAVISLDQYISYKEMYEKKSKDIQVETEVLNERVERREMQEHGMSIRNAVKEIFEKWNLNRELLGELVKNIEFGEVNPKTGSLMLKVFWTWK